MSSDIKLDQGDGNWLLLEGSVVKAAASDFMLDSPARRHGGGPFRRALVHNQQDGLTINFNGDYPGGVSVDGNLAVGGDVRLGSGTVVGGAIAGLQSAIAGLQSSGGATAVRLDALEKTVASLIDFIGAVVIPEWRTKLEVEEGDDMGMSSPPASQLGLVIQYEIDQLNPNFGHGDVISITPSAGTVVARGSTVVVRINLQG